MKSPAEFHTRPLRGDVNPCRTKRQDWRRCPGGRQRRFIKKEKWIALAQARECFAGGFGRSHLGCSRLRRRNLSAHLLYPNTWLRRRRHLGVDTCNAQDQKDGQSESEGMLHLDRFSGNSGRSKALASANPLPIMSFQTFTSRKNFQQFPALHPTTPLLEITRL